MPGKGKAIIRIAMVVGPTVMELARRYGPALKKFREENPEMFEAFLTRIKAVAGVKDSTDDSQEALDERVSILQEHLPELEAAAESDEERGRYVQWRTELDSLRRGIAMLGAMTPKHARKERRRINTRLDAVASGMFGVYVAEGIENPETQREHFLKRLLKKRKEISKADNS